MLNSSTEILNLAPKRKDIQQLLYHYYWSIALFDAVLTATLLWGTQPSYCHIVEPQNQKLHSTKIFEILVTP
jgi:hypothetical protein